MVEDADDRALADALGLRLGETDLPLLLQDRTFGLGGRLAYEPDPMGWAMGVEGDTVLVNLTPAPVLDVATRPYRFRLLNGSNARLYRLAFVAAAAVEEPLPFLLLGTDGGLPERPREVAELFLSPGERADVLLDLRGRGHGEALALKNLAFDPMHLEDGRPEDKGAAGAGDHGMGMGRSDMASPAAPPTSGSAGPGLASGQAFFVLKLVVRESVAYDRPIPAVLSRLPSEDASVAPVRPFALSSDMAGGGDGTALRWLINGQTFDVGTDAVVVRRGAREVWEIRNEARGHVPSDAPPRVPGARARPTR